MLVVSRKRNESIQIGKDTKVVVVGIRRDKVRLGIDAPNHIEVYRTELYDAINRKLQEAAVEDASDGSGMDGAKDDHAATEGVL